MSVFRREERTMSTPARFPIVGIGASAGGIEALEGFFRGLPNSLAWRS
jgi:two-component system CheB/CheR fusion protein